MATDIRGLLPPARQGLERTRGRKRVSLASLVALTIGSCIAMAMSPWATAAEPQKADTLKDMSLDELLQDATSSPSAEPTAPPPGKSAGKPASPQEPGQTRKDEAAAPLATIPVQEVAEPEPAPTYKRSPSRPQIEEVIVTATKRAENVRDVPASITAISGEELEQMGAQDTAAIVKMVPGVNLTSTGDSPARVTIRGISSDITTSSTTGTLFGNVSFSDAYVPFLALDPNPFDIGSVEVLKGPQGTLYGASALNGAIRYVPVLPKFDQYEVKYFGQYTGIHEGDSAATYGAAVNVPLISDTAALRVTAFDRVAPGYIDNTSIPSKDTNRTDQQGIRGILGWRPREAWDIQLTSAYQSTQVRDVGVADSNDGTLETANRPRRSPNNTHYALFDLSATYNADWAQVVSDTSYVVKRGHNFFDATSRNTGQGMVPVESQVYNGDSQTIGQEIRLVSLDDPDSPWKWTTGLFAWQQDENTATQVQLATDQTPVGMLIDLLGPSPVGSLFAANGDPLVFASAADVRIRELAVFGDLTRKLGQDVEVTLGGRLYRTTSGGENVQTGSAVLALRGMSPYVLAGEVKESGFNPKASVLWHATDDVLTYALVSKGFRVGGIQFGLTTPLSANQAPTTFKSDTLWNYEAGVRTQWFDNTLRLDLTGYFVNWIKPQSLQQDGSGVSLFINNVGGVHSTGADFSLQYLFPLPGLMFNTSVSYADTELSKEYKTAGGVVLPKGTQWPLAPKWQTASSLSFVLPIGDWVVGGNASYTFIGKAQPYLTGMDIFNYHQVDFQLSLSNGKIGWLPQIALICNNVTDERGQTNAFSSNLPSADTALKEYYYITPRAVTVRLMGSFGK